MTEHALPGQACAERTAAAVLVDGLVAQGVAHCFGVPGESYLAVLDALHDSAIAFTTCRQEGGAAMMAEAVGRATGRPGICFVTRGPGATNAAAGLHVARQGSTPMILFVGQVERGHRGREAFQEVDCVAAFGALVKWAAEVDDPRRLPEMIARAFATAMNGRPGPVLLALPQDMLTERVAVADAPRIEPVEAAPTSADMVRLRAILEAARAPVLLLGGSRWTPESCAALARFAERWSLPVATTFRRMTLFDTAHPVYAGELGIGASPALLERLRESDLVLAFGTRLGDVPSQGYALFDVPKPRCRLVHVHPDPDELGRVYAADLAIAATPAGLADALDAMPPPGSPPIWAASAGEAHAAYRAFSDVAMPQPGGVNLGEVVVWLRDNLPRDAILTNGAGNFAAWVGRFFRPRRPPGDGAAHLASLSGSMGYGLPAAVAMARLHAGACVVCVSGDGDLLMTGQEFATAVQYALPVIAIVFDNAMFGTIRMHQERAYPGRVSGTALRSPDFAALARAYGGFGATVQRTAEFPAAFAGARASGLPAILHLAVDPEAILPGATLSQLRGS